MSHGTVHEEAEHASHHAGDPFDKVVALTMVVIASLLACVKVLAHRAHNDTLAYQIKAGVKQGEANKAKTEASNQYNFFQFKRMREELVLMDAKQDLRSLAKGKATDKTPAALPEREKRLADLVEELKKEKVEKVEQVAEDIIKKAEKRYASLVAEGYPSESLLSIADAQIKAARYRTEGAVILAKATAEGKKAEKATEYGEEYAEESHRLHGQANWYDAGELGVELAIVLCSVAILSKDRKFWYGGIVVAVLGAIIVAIGLTK